MTTLIKQRRYWRLQQTMRAISKVAYELESAFSAVEHPTDNTAIFYVDNEKTTHFEDDSCILVNYSFEDTDEGDRDDVLYVVELAWTKLNGTKMTHISNVIVGPNLNYAVRMTVAEYLIETEISNLVFTLL